MRFFYRQNNKWGNLVYLLLFLSFLLILATGIISYGRISDSLNNLKSRINQDMELNAIKSIHSNYNNIDNKLEMYVITHRKQYLTQLDSSSSEIRRLMLKLKMSRKVTEQETVLIDSLKYYINSKIKNISKIVRFQQDKSIERLIEDYMNMQSIRTAMDRAMEFKPGRKRRYNLKNNHYEIKAADSLVQNPGKMDILEMRSEEHTSELQSHHDLVCR